MSFEIHPWKIICRGFDAVQRDEMLRLLSVGNGYMGLLGCFEEESEGDSQTWISGAEKPDLNAPEAIRCLRVDGIGVEIDGEPLDLKHAEILDFTAELNMQTGLYLRKFLLNTEKGRIAFKFERFVSAAQKELYASRVSVLPEYEVRIALKPYLNANAGDALWEKLAEEETEDGAALLVRIDENQQGVSGMAVGAAMSCWADGLELEERKYDRGYAEAAYSACAEAGDLISLEKYVLCFNSREYEQNVLTTVALRAAARARELGYDELFATHSGAWKARWAACDITIDGDEKAQQQIRYAMFRLMNASSGEDSCAMSMDDKLAAFPAYMALLGQDAAKQLLPAADGSVKQQAATAHAFFDYATFTGDFEFLRKEGLETLYSIARFFLTSAKDGSLENDWFMGRMASWSIGLFLTQMHRAAPERIAALEITKTETAQMLELVQKLHDPETEMERMQNSSDDDCLLGLYSLGHLYDEAAIRRGYDRCEKTPQNAFSLAVRCILAAQLGKAAEAAELFRTIRAESISGMAALWLAVVQGFGGMRTAEGLAFSPVLPDGWQGYSSGIQYRGRIIRLNVTEKQIKIELADGQPLVLTLCGEEMLLKDRIIRTR